MDTHVAMLRGINVSGQKMIKMDRLKQSMEALKLSSVTTYIQSGNLVFESNTTDEKILAEQIKEKIKEDFGFDVPVIVRNSGRLIHTLQNNPFFISGNKSIDYLHVTFLAEEPDAGLTEKTAALVFAPDEFIISNDVVYVFCPHGYGNTKINNNFFESKLKISATTRNWKTIMKLAELVSSVNR